jgi:peroxiredoxin Q/BCP
MHGELHRAGLVVAGVSPQSPESHHAFAEQYQLPFTLLSDTDKSVIRMYDVDGPLGIGVRRATFLIDRHRHIRDAVKADFRIGKHEAFIHEALAVNGLR